VNTKQARLLELLSTVKQISIVMSSVPGPSIITLLGIPDYQVESKRYFKMSVTICQFIGRNIPEDINIHRNVAKFSNLGGRCYL
jgi:hypothetical protein